MDPMHLSGHPHGQVALVGVPGGDAVPDLSDITCMRCWRPRGKPLSRAGWPFLPVLVEGWHCYRLITESKPHQRHPPRGTFVTGQVGVQSPCGFLGHLAESPCATVGRALDFG